jgi:hypothetical protein
VGLARLGAPRLVHREMKQGRSKNLKRGGAFA